MSLYPRMKFMTPTLNPGPLTAANIEETTISSLNLTYRLVDSPLNFSPFPKKPEYG